MIKQITDAMLGKAPIAAKRSSKWAGVRADYLKLNPVCESCGRADKLEVHHVVPFHIAPELELNPSNLLSLCENKKNGVNCHLFFGHLGDYKSYNVDAIADAKAARIKLNTRPKKAKE